MSRSKVPDTIARWERAESERDAALARAEAAEREAELNANEAENAQDCARRAESECAALRAELADMKRSRDIERAAAMSNGQDWAAAERKVRK